MKIEVVKEKVFEPSYNGNMDLPGPERVRVYHRFLSAAERNKFIYTKPMKIGGAESGMVEFVQDEEGISRAIITKIENLELDLDGKSVKIETAKALFETEGIPSGLVREIEVYCLTATPEVDKLPLK